jgi:hypothetical protein
VTASDAANGPAATEASHAELEAARAELASLAVRIEALKKEVAAGRAGRTQLQPLLARAQELAALIERLQPSQGVPALAPVGPDGQELHERADALRDRADRLDQTRSKLDVRIGELRRRARLEQSLQSVGGASDVLADSAPRAVPSSRAGGASAASASPSASGSTGATGATSAGNTTSSSLPSTPPPSTNTAPPPSSGQPTTPSASAPAGPSPSADAAARALSVPPGPETDPLQPASDDSLQELLRKRARLHGEVSTLRSQADALDAEATRTENVR